MASTAAKITNAIARTSFLWFMHHEMKREYTADRPSRNLFTGVNMMSWKRLVLRSFLSSWAQSMGTSVRAAVVDTIIIMDTIQPSWRNIMPAMPLIMVRGRNTHSMVSVEAMTEIPTSAVPCTAASLGFSPFSIWEVTFSRTTIASSTTIPMAMDRALMEMMLRVFPEKNRYIRDARRAIGILSITIRVPLHLPRNRNTTSMTTRKVIRMVSIRDLMVLRMFLEESTTVVILISDGRLCSRVARAFLTSLITFTVL